MQWRTDRRGYFFFSSSEFFMVERTRLSAPAPHRAMGLGGCYRYSEPESGASTLLSLPKSRLPKPVALSHPAAAEYPLPL
ncbi:hypothetical protein Busp01_11090 [Trinickia caryophylli]|uniref:Uncharacterized protein n=1 Tax=Trinickia caryophylli TaxID=28094 RepID=A0A1X7D4P8_TRICW|nr:hypothetical protein Busp01_11090 [Trinickia caryophylli]SMF08904.1 hypothetical protein SAMN06295900_102393 [Trinickia caryophylli]